MLSVYSLLLSFSSSSALLLHSFAAKAGSNASNLSLGIPKSTSAMKGRSDDRGCRHRRTRSCSAGLYWDGKGMY